MKWKVLQIKNSIRNRGDRFVQKSGYYPYNGVSKVVEALKIRSFWKYPSIVSHFWADLYAVALAIDSVRESRIQFARDGHLFVDGATNSFAAKKVLTSPRSEQALAKTPKKVKSASIASRMTSEVTRMTLEVIRMASEVIRGTSEVTRMTSEVTRMTSEVERMASEVIRGTLEAIRMALEVIRGTPTSHSNGLGSHSRDPNKSFEWPWKSFEWPWKSFE